MRSAIRNINLGCTEHVTFSPLPNSYNGKHHLLSSSKQDLKG